MQAGPAGHPRRGGGSGGSRSTSCRSWSTSCGARCPSSARARRCPTRSPATSPTPRWRLRVKPGPHRPVAGQRPQRPRLGREPAPRPLVRRQLVAPARPADHRPHRSRGPAWDGGLLMARRPQRVRGRRARRPRRCRAVPVRLRRRRLADGRRHHVGRRDVPSTAPTTEPVGPESTPTTVAPPLPQPVESVPKVKRQGQPGTPTVTAPGAAFTKPVRYPDGVQLAIVRGREGRRDRPRAGRHGRPRLRPLRGAPHQRLRQGHQPRPGRRDDLLRASRASSRPRSTPRAPGRPTSSAASSPAPPPTARYAFAVPAKELGRVTMVVDFDGVHTSATYSGAVVTS